MRLLRKIIWSIGAGICIGLGVKIATFLDKPVILPFFPDILDSLCLILVGVLLIIEVHWGILKNEAN